MKVQLLSGVISLFLFLIFSSCQPEPVPTVYPVTPSETDQNFSFEGEVSVTIPGGLLETSDTLSIGFSNSSLPETADSEIETLGIYNISLNEHSGFDDKMVLEFSYNESLLDYSIPEDMGFGVSYWDEEIKMWLTVESTVDTENKKIVVETNHLSTWAVWRAQGYRYIVTEQGNFNVYYKPTAHAPILNKETGLTMQQLAVRVGEYLEHCYTTYKDAGFKVPSTYITRINTFINNIVQDAQWGGITGWIYLPLSEMNSNSKIAHDAGHELFHYVQNQYSSIYRAKGRMWWLEGTPDYASAVLCWNKLDDMSHFDDMPNRFEDSFYSELKVNAYYGSRFIQWLAKYHGVNFKEMWDYVEENSSIAPISTRYTFEEYLLDKTDKTFSNTFEDYVIYTLFNSDSPFSDSGLAQLASMSKRRVLSEKNPEYTESFSLEADHTARIWQITALPPENSKVSTIEISTGNVPDNCHVEIWLLKNNERGSGNYTLKSVLIGTTQKSGNLILESSDAIYAVMFNSAESSKNITLTAKTVEEDQDECVISPDSKTTTFEIQLDNWYLTNAFRMIIDSSGSVIVPDGAFASVQDLTDWLGVITEKEIVITSSSSITENVALNGDYDTAIMLDVYGDGSVPGVDGSTWEHQRGGYRFVNSISNFRTIITDKFTWSDSTQEAGTYSLCFTANKEVNYNIYFACDYTQDRYYRESENEDWELEESESGTVKALIVHIYTSVW